MSVAVSVCVYFCLFVCLFLCMFVYMFVVLVHSLNDDVKAFGFCVLLRTRMIVMASKTVDMQGRYSPFFNELREML